MVSPHGHRSVCCAPARVSVDGEEGRLDPVHALEQVQQACFAGELGGHVGITNGRVVAVNGDRLFGHRDPGPCSLSPVVAVRLIDDEAGERLFAECQDGPGVAVVLEHGEIGLPNLLVKTSATVGMTWRASSRTRVLCSAMRSVKKSAALALRSKLACSAEASSSGARCSGSKIAIRARLIASMPLDLAWGANNLRMVWALAELTL
jgi:hypothetical protein